ncbi:Dedicator of cytokinesis protein 7 [Trichinella pseudospiralis]|uniref:Dedicator of cytokinesis protein 7 n=1 Tax=Trichinella pseudospiralis TaxID=6337 RepID=A0A0V0XV07_TRIPS|nr:Dedicator of cytokinesis protein 7 [Trichinella pseudospiralis]
MIGQLVKIISKLVDVSCDQHDRSSLLAAYIKYGRLCTGGKGGDFSKKCADALRENKRLIGPNQREYQKELERNYLHFTEQLTPILSSVVSQQQKRCCVSQIY